MNTTRRQFIKSTSLAVAGAALINKDAFAAPMKYTGLQLYSVRDAMQKNPADTLKKLSAGGYKYVEHAGYDDGRFYGYAPKDFKKLLDDLGLKMLSGHSRFSVTEWDSAKNDFTDVWKQTVADSALVGQQFVINPWLDENLRGDTETLKKLMHLYNKSGELCKAHGMKFGYHNHNFEFTVKMGDGNLYDYILQNTEPSLVAQQMDFGNMVGPGAKAMDYIKKYPGRFQLLHVKDEIKSDGKGEMSDGYDSCILGEGILPVKENLALATKIGGTTHYMIEQESYQGKDPVDCCIKDLKIMKKWGY
ncbi:sugar phosphate isomerase/epimerase family protein [Mucilaginibacter ginkgonis]|uniref:Sugar phosphate isomerase/epimerase n=1 Tax=Mucilaginibacter ginkgonis TaxID=2682091 RepID=A0A6I4IPB2_9SPHI|nr:sugar phosphate isomerase/epimerase [Mucilaginibacter ginkgonis]QQL50681.1 sugar phosphate isomerase/epimerase [Mucilaginibacter ginkgonis]